MFRQRVEPVEATWREIVTFFRSYLKWVTYSEIDGEATPICYAYVSKSIERYTPNTDFEPLTFIRSFYFQSRKGMYMLYTVIFSCVNSEVAV